MSISKKPNIKSMAAIEKIAKKSKTGAAVSTHEDKHKHKPRATSFLLRDIDNVRLEGLRETLNDISSRPISKTAVLRGLLLLGEKTTAKKLLKMIRESSY